MLHVSKRTRTIESKKPFRTNQVITQDGRHFLVKGVISKYNDLDGVEHGAEFRIPASWTIEVVEVFDVDPVTPAATVWGFDD